MSGMSIFFLLLTSFFMWGMGSIAYMIWHRRKKNKADEESEKAIHDRNMRLGEAQAIAEAATMGIGIGAAAGPLAAGAQVGVQVAMASHMQAAAQAHAAQTHQAATTAAAAAAAQTATVAAQSAVIAAQNAQLSQSIKKSRQITQQRRSQMRGAMVRQSSDARVQQILENEKAAYQDHEMFMRQEMEKNRYVYLCFENFVSPSPSFFLSFSLSLSLLSLLGILVFNIVVEFRVLA